MQKYKIKLNTNYFWIIPLYLVEIPTKRSEAESLCKTLRDNSELFFNQKISQAIFSKKTLLLQSINKKHELYRNQKTVPHNSRSIRA